MKHVTNLRHDCDVHGCYRAELWDWTPFNDCFGDSGIRISDVDGMVERNGQFLMLDGKRIGREGQTYIAPGHIRMYRRFAESKGGHSIVFHGHPPATIEVVRIWRPGGGLQGPEPCDLGRLKKIVSNWYVWANGMSMPVPVPPTRSIDMELSVAAAPERNDGEWDDVQTQRPPDWIPPNARTEAAA